MDTPARYMGIAAGPRKLDSINGSASIFILRDQPPINAIKPNLNISFSLLFLNFLFVTSMKGANLKAITNIDTAVIASKITVRNAHPTIPKLKYLTAIMTEIMEIVLIKDCL